MADREFLTIKCRNSLSKLWCIIFGKTVLEFRRIPNKRFAKEGPVVIWRFQPQFCDIVCKWLFTHPVQSQFFGCFVPESLIFDDARVDSVVQILKQHKPAHDRPRQMQQKNRFKFEPLNLKYVPLNKISMSAKWRLKLTSRRDGSFSHPPHNQNVFFWEN